jgi:drug/metabolite transporter (DMT)-like permease
MFKDQLKLHFIVVIFGFTAILGVLISIPALETVFFRSTIAFIGTAIWLYLKKSDFLLKSKKQRREAIKLFAVGFIIAAHWITFFWSAKIANVSVCLVGLATATLWTSILEPFFFKKTVKWYEVLLGALTLAGLSVIFGFDFDYWTGLILALVSAFLATLFSIFNGLLAQKHNHLVITFYEMLGAAFFCALFFPFYLYLDLASPNGLELNPSFQDWICLLVLGVICTVYAYSAMVELLKRMSVFTSNLAINLEPVYGIIMAAVFFKEYEQIHASFYVGAMIILLSVATYPLIKRWDTRRKTKHL